MCHVSKISAANRPLTPPRIWFRRTGGGRPRPIVWARGRMRHSILGCAARWSTSDHTPVIPGGGTQCRFIHRKNIIVYDRMIVSNCMVVKYSMKVF